MSTTRSLLTMNRRGTLTIPKEVRKGLNDDTVFEVVRREDGVIELRPLVMINASQQWFWSERWQRMEKEADADIASGRLKTFNELEDLLADLDDESTDN